MSKNFAATILLRINVFVPHLSVAWLNGKIIHNLEWDRNEII